MNLRGKEILEHLENLKFRLEIKGDESDFD